MSGASIELVSGVTNFRDVGGLPAGAGTTRHGVLFRSGALSRLDDDGRRTLHELGVERIVDLRSDDELAREPSRVDGLGVETVRAPMFVGSLESFLASGVTLDDSYLDLLDNAGERIATVAHSIAAGHPTLVHCAIGKDRTGVSVAVTLAAAGVDDEAIVGDYALTEQNLPASRARQIRAWLARAHPGSRHLEELYLHSPARAMRHVLAHLHERWGDGGAYLREAGVSADELAALRSALVIAP